MPSPAPEAKANTDIAPDPASQAVVSPPNAEPSSSVAADPAPAPRANQSKRPKSSKANRNNRPSRYISSSKSDPDMWRSVVEDEGHFLSSPYGKASEVSNSEDNDQ